ncbi:hypothetical protein AB3S75_002588 [Citrus x aurantiifolia]
MRVPLKSQQNSQSQQSPERVSSPNNNNNNNIINSVNVIARSIGGISNSNNNIHSRRPNTTNNINITSPANSGSKCYEPTSVLELRRSPSPIPEWDRDEHMLRTMDWESFIKDLGGLDDDCSSDVAAPQLQIQHLHPISTDDDSIDHQQESDFNFNFSSNFNVPAADDVVSLSSSTTQYHDNFPDHHPDAVSNNDNNMIVMNNLGGGFEFDYNYIEELIRAAECLDSNELQGAQMILAHLNHSQNLVGSPPLVVAAGKPLQRAAIFFKEALSSLLLSLLNGLTRPTSHLSSSWPEIIQSVRAYKAFTAISPIPMFTHFITTQALLESLFLDRGSGSPPLIHVIDFDIGFGGQYASFMREIADKAAAARHSNYSTSLRITAVVPDDYVTETRLVKANLVQFARELRIGLHVDFVPARSFEMLSFKAVKLMDGEKLAILLSPTVFRRLGGNSTDNAAAVAAFVTDIRRISPNVVVFTDNEAWGDFGSGTTAPFSFRKNFVTSLEYYTMVFESLDAAAAAMNAGDWARKIETHLLRPKIMAAVEVAGRRVAPWREVFSGAGMRPVQLSQFADFLAECLLAKVQVGGFHVAKRQAELVLCWHRWALVATSAWRC